MAIKKEYKTVLSIAGSDSGGGAGIQADIKAASACGCYAMTAITAITAQNTQGVTDIHAVPAEMIGKQITAVAEDIPIDAVKIGMVPTAEAAVMIARLLERYSVPNIIIDPVMVATSGDRLIAEDAIDAIIEHIFPLAALVTPNIPEAKFISGLEVSTEEDYPEVAGKFREKGVKNVLIKSGHLTRDFLTDYLFEGTEVYRYRYERIHTPNTHGTGCTLSSAIASFLALGYPLDEAVGLAEDYIHKAILNGADYTLGHGHGPVHHFFRFWE